MFSIMRKTEMAAGTGYRYLLFLAPLVLIGISLICGVAIGVAGFAIGLPPAEYASGFLSEAFSTLLGTTLTVAALATVLGSTAGFALCCTGWSKTWSGLSEIAIWAVSRYCPALSILRVPGLEIPRPAVISFSDPMLSSASLRAAPTPAGLSGALPLLN